MATISVDRVIAADPTSTALLLAGPTAVDLWPGVTRLDTAADPIRVEATLPALAARAARVEIRARRPRRLPTSYVTRFTFAGGGLPETDGEVTLSYATADGVPVATAAVLTLTWPGGGSASERARVAAVFRSTGEGFLANLAAVAEERSYAA